MDTPFRSALPLLRLHRAASRALTLIEMMIVVAIIGLIAGLVIMQYSHSIDVGEATTEMMQIKQVVNSVIQYRLDKHQLPPVTGDNNVAPALFGGAGNQYMNATATSPNGQILHYRAESATTFGIFGDQNFDGSALQALKRLNGLAPVPGTNYVIYYDSFYGNMYACCS